MAQAARLKLKLGQKLKLAPQLRQAIELLQLNRLELRDRINEALETNPLLERETDHGTEDESNFADSSDDTATPAEESGHPEEDFGWEDLPEGYSAVPDAPNYDEFIADRSSESLHQHLLWQANVAGFSTRDEAIARAIIYALDEDGYLSDDIDTLRASLAPEYLVTPDEVLAVLERVQHFEPVGVAARSLGESLSIQLRTLPASTPYRTLAEQIVGQHLDLLGAGDLDRVARLTGFETAEVQQAAELIRRLDPRPGLRFSSDHQDFVVPDVYVYPEGDGVRIVLDRDHQPGLRLNARYAGLFRASRGQDRQYLKDRLQEARWLIASLEMRNHTLLSVTEAIMLHQREFLDRGEAAMRPLLQKDIAAVTGVHESTVSRATSDKYVHTPRGTFELKHFFSVGISTSDGGQVAAIAVKALIEQLVTGETGQKPLSDQALSQRLADHGIVLARRTVAKYREQLGIPGSATRRRRRRPVAKTRVC